MLEDSLLAMTVNGISGASPFGNRIVTTILERIERRNDPVISSEHSTALLNAEVASSLEDSLLAMTEIGVSGTSPIGNSISMPIL